MRVLKLRRVRAEVAVLLLLGAVVLSSTACQGRASPADSGTTPAPGVGSTAASASPFASHRASAALAAFDRAFLVSSGGQAYYAESTNGSRADFWRLGEMTEMVEDAYQVSGDPAYKRGVVALQRGMTSYFRRRWVWRSYNDDIMWMVIACLRAYEITGDRQYLTMARRNFDITYARASSSGFGGGLWWTTAKTEKNVTTTAPAAIAACKLAAALHDRTYLGKAERLFGWIRARLYDPRTGAVYDRIVAPPSGAGPAVVRRTGLTYNQGSFIGAAELLYKATGRRPYYDDALRTLEYTRLHLTGPGGILPSEAGGPDSNGGGFKGIFCRWAVTFTHDNHITSFDAWFQQNASVAWSHRDARGLMGADWSSPTPIGRLYAWDCSAAVVLMQVTSGR